MPGRVQRDSWPPKERNIQARDNRRLYDQADSLETNRAQSDSLADFLPSLDLFEKGLPVWNGPDSLDFPHG